MMLLNRGGSRAGLGGGALLSVLCEMLHSTIIRYNTHCRLGDHDPPRPPLDQTLLLEMSSSFSFLVVQFFLEELVR